MCSAFTLLKSGSFIYHSTTPNASCSPFVLHTQKKPQKLLFMVKSRGWIAALKSGGTPADTSVSLARRQKGQLAVGGVGTVFLVSFGLWCLVGKYQQCSVACWRAIKMDITLFKKGQWFCGFCIPTPRRKKKVDNKRNRRRLEMTHCSSEKVSRSNKSPAWRSNTSWSSQRHKQHKHWAGCPLTHDVTHSAFTHTHTQQLWLLHNLASGLTTLPPIISATFWSAACNKSSHFRSWN